MEGSGEKDRQGRRSDEGKRGISEDFRRKRSRILLQITVLIVVVFVAAGLASFFLFRGSQHRLIQRSVGKLIDTQAFDFSSTYEVVTDFIAAEFESRFADPKVIERFVVSVLSKELSPEQEDLNRRFEDMVAAGLNGMELMATVIPPGVFSDDAVVVASNDPSLIYQWKMPAYIVESFEKGRLYIYCEDGIPELGLTGEQLLLLNEYGEGQQTIWFMAVRPMARDVREIRSFFNEEARKTNLMLAMVIALSVLGIIIITFFILNRLIRKQITEPIDELSAAAEKVMEGDLEVEIEVREGEEFEGLKRIFKEMVDSIKLMIERSTME